MNRIILFGLPTGPVEVMIGTSWNKGMNYIPGGIIRFGEPDVIEKENQVVEHDFYLTNNLMYSKEDQTLEVHLVPVHNNN